MATSTVSVFYPDNRIRRFVSFAQSPLMSFVNWLHLYPIKKLSRQMVRAMEEFNVMLVGINRSHYRNRFKKEDYEECVRLANGMRFTIRKFSDMPSVSVYDMEVVYGQIERELNNLKQIIERRERAASLVSAISPENQHELIDFGEPIGREAW